jgi:DNA-binding HxlR family transcriptional regulator
VPDPLTTDTVACRRLTTALEFLGRRWNGAIVLAVGSGANRFSLVLRAVPGLSDRMLAARLRELEQIDVVSRTVIPTTPVQIRYALTDHGARVLRALRPLVGVGAAMEQSQH